MSYSLARPLPNLTWFQRLIWPLVYAQLIALKLWVRKHYGRGVPYRFWISPLGRVHLTRLAWDMTWSYAAPGSLERPAFDFACGLSRPALMQALAPQGAPAAPSFPDLSLVRFVGMHGPAAPAPFADSS